MYRIPNREPDADGIIQAAVLPLRDLVVFPRMVSPIFVGREGSLLAVQEAQLKEQTVIGLTQHDAELDTPGPGDFLEVGVEMAVGRLLQMPDGSHSALVQGRRRVEILELREQAVPDGASPRRSGAGNCARQSRLSSLGADLFERCVQLDRSIPMKRTVRVNISRPVA